MAEAPSLIPVEVASSGATTFEQDDILDFNPQKRSEMLSYDQVRDVREYSSAALAYALSSSEALAPLDDSLPSQELLDKDPIRYIAVAGIVLKGARQSKLDSQG